MEDQTTEARLAVTAAALSGDSGALYHIVSGLLGEGVSFEMVLFDLLIPTEREVGHRWQTGDYMVSEEHAATAAIETVISVLAGAFDRPENGRRVVVATAEGDNHSLPGRAVNAHLLSLGYRTTFLGASVLSSDLRDYLLAERPDAVVLSCAMTTGLLGARHGIRESHDAGVPVLVGGGAFGLDGAWAKALGADAWVPEPRQVPETLETWQPDPSQAEAEARNPSPDLLDLVSRRAAIVGRAQEEFEILVGGQRDPRLAATLSLLLGAVEASLLVGQATVTAEHLKWQSATLSAHGWDVSEGLVDSLVRALTGEFPAAAAILSRAVEMESQGSPETG
ncbi:MAG TPA: cobalamin-dependent protein [Acidimicrobiia bacterium]|nr:cobalamin-dependent protein [Acidimicrobiia bacterium]